jgi:hypothetical protein
MAKSRQNLGLLKHSSKHIKSSVFGITGKDKDGDCKKDKNLFGVLFSLFERGFDNILKGNESFWKDNDIIEMNNIIIKFIFLKINFIFFIFLIFLFLENIIFLT